MVGSAVSVGEGASAPFFVPGFYAQLKLTETDRKHWVFRLLPEILCVLSANRVKYRPLIVLSSEYALSFTRGFFLHGFRQYPANRCP